MPSLSKAVDLSETVDLRFEAAPIRRKRFRLAYQVIEPLVAIADSIILVGASVAGGAFYHWMLGYPFNDTALSAACGVIASLAYALAAYRWELHRLRLLVQRKRDYARVVGCWLWAILVVTVVLFLL